VEDIVMEGTLHRKQAVPAWIVKDQPQINPGFFLCCVNGDKWGFRNLLKQLHHSQLVILAKLIPLDGFKNGVPVRKVLIEPVTTNVASVQLVNTKNFPHLLNADTMDSIGIDEYPIGCDINKLLSINTLEFSDMNGVYNLGMEPPSVWRDLFDKRKEDDMSSVASPARKNALTSIADTPATSIAETINRDYHDNYPDEMEMEEEVEEIIELPAHVDAFEKSLHMLYMEVMYENKYPMVHTIQIIDTWIQHLVDNNHSQQDIVNQLYSHTLSIQDLKEKHTSSIPQLLKHPPQNMSFEQNFLLEWWEGVKSRPSYEKNDWLTTLKFKE
jgi:hypothetical protein